MASCCFIELASGVVRAGCVEGYGKKARLSSYYEERFTASEDDLPRVLNPLFESVASRVKLAGQHLVLALSSRYLLFREVSFPFSDRKRVARTLPFQLEEKLPVPIDEVVIDAYEVSREGEGSVWFACCVRKRLLKALLEACEVNGMDPAVVAPSYAGFPHVLPPASRRLVLDLGAETTDLFLLDGERIPFFRSLRFAGNTIVKAIASALSVEPEVAEKTLQLSHGFENGDQTLRDVLEAEFGRLVREIRLTLSALPAGREPEVVLLAGGLSGIKGLAEYLSAKLSFPCEVADPDMLGASSLLNRPSTVGYLAPAGLAAAEGKGKRPLVNFRKDEFGFHGAFDRIAFPLLVMLVLVAAMMGGAIWFFDGVHKKALASRTAAEEKIRAWWKDTFPPNFPPPKDLTKYKAFVDDRLKKLQSETELIGRYYTPSVLPALLNASKILKGLHYRFITLEAAKSRIKLVGEIDPEELNLLNDALQRSKRYFRDYTLSTDKTAKGAYRFTVNFLMRGR